MAGRMPPSTTVHDNPAATAASNEAAVANYARLQQWIQRECAECDAAIDEHRRQAADYRTQKARLLELQKKIAHPIMVPFGSVGFMPGKLVRTNEVLVLLGANHFAECSVHDTAKIIDRRVREISSLIDKLEAQKRNAAERLNFAQGLFGGATAGVKDDLVEIREDYDERKEAEARRKRVARATAAREEKKVPQATFESMMSRLDELEAQERKEARKPRGRRSELDSDDEMEEGEDDGEEEEEDGEVEEEVEEEGVGEVKEKEGEEEKEAKSEEEEEDYVPVVPKPPRGVSEEEYKRLLARLDQLDTSDDEDEEDEEEEGDDVIEEVDEEVDSDDVSEDEDLKRAKVAEMRRERLMEERRAMVERERSERAAVQSQQPRRPLIEVIEDEPIDTVPAPAQSIAKQKMTVVSENDRVVDLVEYQNQQEEDDKSKENAPSGKGSKLTHKRSVRFKKNLEAGPCEQKSIDSVDDVLPVLDTHPNPRSILRNKSEESPIDKIAFSEMEDQRSTTILPSGDAFSGCVVERSAELPIVFKPVDEPPRRVSRFKLQRMQQATE